MGVGGDSINMKKLRYTPAQKKRASTMMALGTSEYEAAGKLISAGLYREAAVHLYFTCFYVSQAVLCQTLKPRPSHNHLESEMHRMYGRSRAFPRRYVKLHSSLHKQRNEFHYNTTHTPDPDVLRKQLTGLGAYVAYALKIVPRVEVMDLLKSFLSDNPKTIKDFSFDIYCPKTYSHHTRLTFWQPPFYLDIFGVSQIVRHASEMLRMLRVKRTKDYVLGLNSRVNQYRDDHLLMIDVDAVNPAVESALKPFGGILLKSGRGFHFIGKQIISGRKEWRRAMGKVLRLKRLTPHIDKDHVDISLKRGYSTLRVTSSPVKPQIPYFYKEI